MATSAVGNQKTIQQIIDSGVKSTSERNTGELGKDDFLNLLVTQLRYQDPLSPTDNKEFIGQMAQFSSLEQMQNMNSTLGQTRAFGLIGKHVIASVVDETTKESKAIEGDVANVKISAGKAYVVVNGEDIPVENVAQVTESSTAALANTSANINLIGYNAKGAVYNSSSGDIIGVSGVVGSIQKGTYENYAVMNDVSVKISKILDEATTTDKDFMKNYLNENIGQKISVNIIDKETNKQVPITATLKDFHISADGTVNATMDGVQVPVDSIYNIEPAEESESAEEILLQQILQKVSDEE